jgi:hypothetical protein
MFRMSVTAPAKLFRRDIITTHKIKFPEGLYFEDNVFFYRYLLQCEKIGVIREALYRRRVHPESMTQKPSSRYMDFVPIALQVERVVRQSPHYQQVRDDLGEFLLNGLRGWLNRIPGLANKWRYYRQMQQLVKTWDKRNFERQKIFYQVILYCPYIIFVGVDKLYRWREKLQLKAKWRQMWRRIGSKKQ